MNQIPTHLHPQDPEPIAPQDFLNLGLEPLVAFADRPSALTPHLPPLAAWPVRQRRSP